MIPSRVVQVCLEALTVVVTGRQGPYMCERPPSIIHPMPHIAQCISPNCRMYLSIWQNVFVCIAQCISSYMGPTCSNIYPMLHMAHCSCCSCLVCLWLTALLARGGSQKAGSQAGCLHMENSPAGNSSSPSSTLCWLCLSVSISTSCIVHQPAFLPRRRRN